MANEQTIRESKDATRELTAAEANAVSGGLGSKNSPLPGPSPTFPPVGG